MGKFSFIIYTVLIGGVIGIFALSRYLIDTFHLVGIITTLLPLSMFALPIVIVLILLLRQGFKHGFGKPFSVKDIPREEGSGTYEPDNQYYIEEETVNINGRNYKVIDPITNLPKTKVVRRTLLDRLPW